MTALRDAQLRMARYLRSPDRQAPPEGVEARRLAVYRRLVYNNIEGFISAGFPVLRSLYDEAQWRELVQAFIEEHPCQSPYFLEISQEFIQYLTERPGPRPGDPPFAAELAHYEWVELALDIAEGEPPQRPEAANPLALRPRISPLAWLLSYAFPVHRIGPGFQPEAPAGPVFLVVYRNRAEQVSFMEINATTARLLQMVQENTVATGEQLLRHLAGELGRAADALLTFGAEQLNDFAAQGVIGLDRPAPGAT